MLLNIVSYLLVIIAFSALTLLVGWQEEYEARIWWGAGVVIFLDEVQMIYIWFQLMPLPPIVSCLIKIQNGSAFLVPAYPDFHGKVAVKWVL